VLEKNNLPVWHRFIQCLYKYGKIGISKNYIAKWDGDISEKNDTNGNNYPDNHVQHHLVHDNGTIRPGEHTSNDTTPDISG
jgi:hypothetical protein